MTKADAARTAGAAAAVVAARATRRAEPSHLASPGMAHQPADASRSSFPGGEGAVGSWKLARLLGEGEFTRVFAAQPAAEDGHASGDPPAYAIKLPQRDRENDSRALFCLRREALVGQAVNHPHLIPILAAQLTSPPYFLVMPRLEGRRLDQWLARGRFSLAMALCIARQVAEALAALHAAGWIHGDVKPANVILSRRGHATLLDLGFARRRDEPATSRVLVGSAAYLAPEAFISTMAPDIRSDLYSVGVTLFELLANRRPFLESDPAELARRHLASAPPELRRLVPQAPVEVARLVEELLAKEPLRRPQSPRELVERLVPLEIITFADRKPL